MNRLFVPPLALSALALLPASLSIPAARAFEIPMTRTQRAQKLVEEGQGLILRGEYTRAIDSCTRALGIRDDWAPAYLCRSEAKIWAKDPGAPGDIQQALRLDPKSGEPQRLLGIMEFQAGRYRPALEHFDLALSRSKLRPDGITDVYLFRARSHMSLGNLRAALEDVNHGLGVLQGLNGDYSDWSFYSLRAEVLRRQGNAAKADADERRVIGLINERMRRRPDETPDLLRRRAESYSLLQEYPKAAQDYAEVLKGNPDDVRTMIDQAQVLSLAGQHAAAIETLDRALQRSPRQAQALRLRATERIERQDYLGSIQDLDAYLLLEPQDASALAYRGISKRYAGDWRGALDDMDRAQRLRPKDQSLWGHRAYVEEMLGRHATALASAKRALATDPQDLSAHMARAEAGVMLHRCAEAAPSLDWLVAKSTAAGQYRWLRGECRCDAGDFAAGLSDLETAAAVEPGSPEIAQRLAHQHRRYLDRYPLQPDVRLKELRRSANFYDRASRLAALPPMYRLDRAHTLYELGTLLTDSAAADERMRLWSSAAGELDLVTKTDRKNREARELRRTIRKSLAAARRAAAPR